MFIEWPTKGALLVTEEMLLVFEFVLVSMLGREMILLSCSLAILMAKGVPI